MKWIHSFQLCRFGACMSVFSKSESLCAFRHCFDVDASEWVFCPDDSANESCSGVKNVAFLVLKFPV